MEAGEFIDNMKLAFENKADDLALETDFRKHPEWDSLVSISTVAMIFAEYDVQISGDELVSCDSVGELKVMVEGKLAVA